MASSPASRSLFVAGLVDDLRHLSPIAKLAAQIAAAVMVLASGLEVEIVGNNVLAWAIGLLWLVGITNAFNLLDNMDGLAATLAAIACGYFAIDAATEHENETVLVLALSLGLACVGIPALQPPAGPQGSRVHGRLGQPGARVRARLARARVELDGRRDDLRDRPPAAPGARDPDPRHHARHARAPGAAPAGDAGRQDHTSHRLVYYGLSESKAVLLLAVVATALGATALAYNVLDNAG